MSSKQRRPLDDPPSAGSSSEEADDSEEVSEDEGKEQQQEQRQPQLKSKNVESEVEEESEEDDEEGEEEEEDASEDELEQAKKQKTEILSDKKKNPIPESSSETGDSDSLKSPRASDFTVKPVAPPKPTKGQPETPLSKPTKRRPESSAENGKASKLKKAKPSIDNGKGEDEVGLSATAEKKSAINRLWSEQDEIAVLKGLIEFQSKIGKDPSANQGEFHEFVKKSLHVDVSKNQLMDKVRRLKKKYKNNLEKSTNGEDPVLSKPHEYKSFQFSKEIWGNIPDKNSNANAVDDNHANNASNYDKSSIRSAKKSRGNDKLVPVAVPVDNSTVTKDPVKVKGEKVEPCQENEEDFAKLYPFLMSAFSSNYMCDALPGFNIVKKNLNLVGGSELKELDSDWKELNMVETEVLLRKIDLIKKQTKIILDAVKSSKS